MEPTQQQSKREPFWKTLFTHFSNSNTFQEGAALAYYTVFSILPMIIIITSIFGLIWGQQAVSGEIYTEFSGVLGEEAASQIQGIIKSQHTQHNGIWTTLIGFITLALSASGMFNQLHGSFNNIWQIVAKPKNSILAYLSKHIVSFSILITLFFILFISLTINSFLVKYTSDLSPTFPLSILLENLVSFGLVSLMFALMFSFLGDAIIHWKVAVWGGLFTAALFLLGKYAIGLYIGHSNISSTFGSASLLALIMIWVYYTSQIIFLGASFVYVLGKRIGHEILPDKNAVKVVKQEITDH